MRQSALLACLFWLSICRPGYAQRDPTDPEPIEMNYSYFRPVLLPTVRQGLSMAPPVPGSGASPSTAEQDPSFNDGVGIDNNIKHQPLIHIKVRVIEVQRENSLSASSVLDYVGNTGVMSLVPTTNNINGSNQRTSGATRFNAVDPNLPTLIGVSNGALNSGSGMLVNLTAEHINWVASLLATQFRGDMITAPQVTTLNGKNVTFRAGAKIPFTLGQNVVNGTTNNIQQVFYKHVGTFISVTPQIVNWDDRQNGEGKALGAKAAQVQPAPVAQRCEHCNWQPSDCTINLNISVRLSDLGSTATKVVDTDGKIVDSELTSETNVRAISNIVQIKSGHGVVIGGLIAMHDTEQASKVPVLGDIPYVGAAFRSKQTERAKTETLIFVEASVLPSFEDCYDECGQPLAKSLTSQDFCDARYHLEHDLCGGRLAEGLRRSGVGDPYLPPPTYGEKEYCRAYHEQTWQQRHYTIKSEVRDTFGR